MHNNDDLFKKLAAQYIGEDSRRLSETMDTLIESDKTDALDQKIRKKIDKEKNNRLYRRWSAVAAAAVIAFAVFRLMPYDHSPQPMVQAPQYEVITLSLALPERFELTATEQDKEKTIYYIADQSQDDVVLTVAETAFAEDVDTADFTEIEIDGTAAYAYASADYQLLRFEKDDLQYVLSCRYDINTLVRLAGYL